MEEFCTCSIHSVVGITCIVVGLIIWRLQKVGYIHSLHRAHVSEDDIPAYTSLFGRALFALGVFVTAAGIVGIFSAWSWAVCAAGFVVFTVLALTAQKRYNGGVF